MADLEHDVPITPKSAFYIASAAKQFTAAVSCGWPGGQVVARRRHPQAPPGAAALRQTITIRHLIHHTSGLRDYTDLMALAGWQTEDWTTAEQALATIVRQKELNFRPGAQYLYSNSGFFLLSVIASRAAGSRSPTWRASGSSSHWG